MVHHVSMSFCFGLKPSLVDGVLALNGALCLKVSLFWSIAKASVGGVLALTGNSFNLFRP